MSTLIIYTQDDVLNHIADPNKNIVKHLPRLIAYMVYREYLIDAGVYQLPAALLRLYCKLRSNYTDRFTLVGTHSTNKSLYQASITIVNNDVYIKLI